MRLDNFITSFVTYRKKDKQKPSLESFWEMANKMVRATTALYSLMREEYGQNQACTFTQENFCNHLVKMVNLAIFLHLELLVQQNN